MVRDFSRFALQIYGMHKTKDEQRAYCKEIMLIRSEETMPSTTASGKNMSMPSTVNTR